MNLDYVRARAKLMIARADKALASDDDDLRIAARVGVGSILRALEAYESPSEEDIELRDELRARMTALSA